jgi:hypothetical protein
MMKVEDKLKVMTTVRPVVSQRMAISFHQGSGYDGSSNNRCSIGDGGCVDGRGSIRKGRGVQVAGCRGCNSDCEDDGKNDLKRK